MLYKSPFSIFKLSTLIITSTLITACSGSGEDVHVTFCKNLISTHLSTSENIDWLSQEHEIHRPEYARIKLTFKSQRPAEESLQASCYYQYDAVDDNAMNQAEPLSAYATTPYRMIIDGQELKGQELQTIVKATTLKQGKEMVEQVQKEVATATQTIKEKLTQ